MSEQSIPNVSDGAVTGLGHDPVQGAEISRHDPVEVVDHPHNTSDDTVGRPAVDGEQFGADEQENPGTGEPSEGTEVPVGPTGTLDTPQDGQDSPQDAPEGDEGTPPPAQSDDAQSAAPAPPPAE